MIEEYKNNGGFTVTKGGYTIKTKKSKGEILTMNNALFGHDES